MIKLKKISLLLFALALVFFPTQYTGATSITLSPAASSVSLGDTLNISIFANIDQGDAIIGFGFDLLLSASGLLYTGFTPNSPLFADDPILALLSDNDLIRGASGGDLFNGPPVYGNNILLGALSFTATGFGNIIVSLTADDLSTSYTEGLIPLDVTKTNFMPPVNAASVSVPVPEPATMLLLGSGLIGLAGLRRRFRK